MIYYVIKAYYETKVIAAVDEIDAIPRRDDVLYVEHGEHAGVYRVAYAVHTAQPDPVADMLPGGTWCAPDIFILLDTFEPDTKRLDLLRKAVEAFKR